MIARRKMSLAAFLLMNVLVSVQETAYAKGSTATSLVAEVQKLSDVGDYEAVNQMKMLHPELTKSAQALECFAFSDQDLHNMEIAMAEFSAAERLAPSDPHLQTSLVYGLYGMGSYREALYRINKIIAVRPRDARSRAIQALILQQMSSAKESLAAMKEAEKLELSLPVWEAKYNFAIGNLNQAQTNQTAEDCIKALPNNTKARMFHATALRNAGRLAAAAGDFQKVLKTNPNHMTALTLLADAYRLDKKYKQAVECLERRLKLARTDHEMLHINRDIAKTYEQAKNLTAAAAARERIIAVYVKRKQCRNEREMKDILSCCRDLINLKRWKEAAERLSLILDRYPKSSEGLERRAQCYANLKQDADAIKDYTHLIENHSDVASWYRQRAVLLKRTGRAEEAAKDLKRAQALDATQRSDENL